VERESENVKRERWSAERESENVKGERVVAVLT